MLKLRSYRNVVPLGVQWQWMGIRWEAMPGQASGPGSSTVLSSGLFPYSGPWWISPHGAGAGGEEGARPHRR
ncbi:protein of unknown function [Methanoculleus bourgensis]|uniref:Uncharacterized protein n=1 Tax=Methanoculleus bourgensis TaxID=83986 RepID=A0A0X3BKY7_9EURY|nr:protein of unknown function [Methanoculleus bourgensis]